MSNTIFLKNKAQVILFEAELKGQLSDGFWENATPSDHWEVPVKAEVVVGYEPHLTFRPSRGYKFHNKDLFEMVGDRMVFIVKVYKAFPQLDFGRHHTYAHLDSRDLRAKAQQGGHDSYWDKVLYNIETDTGMSFENAQARVEAQEYTVKQCRSDLRQISQVFKAARQ